MDTLKNKEEIIAWLDRYKVENYTLIEDDQYGFIVDVAGGVNLKNKNLSMISIKFNVVGGYFDCSRNKLKTLNGCPASVKKDFICHNNQLTSLEG